MKKEALSIMKPRMYKSQLVDNKFKQRKDIDYKNSFSLVIKYYLIRVEFV